MLNNNFINKSFVDGLLYSPKDILSLVESETNETLKFIKIKMIVEKLELDTFELFEETINALEAYQKKLKNTIFNEGQKKNLLTEVSNLVLGLVKFLAPMVIKLISWLAGLLVSTKIFGQAAVAITGAIKKITPDAVKKALIFAKDSYQNADTAFQNISQTVSQKVTDAFKGTEEKPPVIDGAAIGKAHANLVSKIETWPLIGKIVGWGKKLGITPKGFYTFLGIAVLSALAMFGSLPCAIILVLYGANTVAQKIAKASTAAASNIADKTAQGMAKAKGEAPASGSNDDMFADLDKELAGFDDTGEAKPPDQKQEIKLSPELEDASTKWGTKLKTLIDKGDKDNAIAKIKDATQQLVKSNDIKKEEVKPFISSVATKAKVAEEIKTALLNAMSDIAVVAVS